MSLHIREVTKENWRSVAELAVSEQQAPFIESNAYSLAESQYDKKWISVGLYDDETLVGYAMLVISNKAECMAGSIYD